MLKTQVIVLGVSRYSFPDQKTGEIIEGSKVHYIEQSVTDEENVVGHTPQTANMPYRLFDDLAFKSLPAVYDCELKVDLNGRKPSIKVRGFTFLAPIEMKEIPPLQTAK